MDKDEPAERPADWSDPRVRFAYYRLELICQLLTGS